jgi:hypothetical protein
MHGQASDLLAAATHPVPFAKAICAAATQSSDGPRHCVLAGFNDFKCASTTPASSCQLWRFSPTAFGRRGQITACRAERDSELVASAGVAGLRTCVRPATP